MDSELSYFEDYLREEFSSYPGVRVRVVWPTGTVRSIDLPQDYDEATGTLHRRTGVLVQTRRNEYFFPRDWIKQTNRTQINELVEKIKSALA